MSQLNFKKSNILSFKESNVSFSFSPLHLCKVDDNFINEVVKICSEKEIYNFLFKEMLKGAPYTKESAFRFIEWSRKGWQLNSYFVFFIINENGLPVGCLDIKENDKVSAEVGYWLSEKASGLMTNALNELCNQAKENGFKKLYADCLIDNQKSQRVLTRSNFIGPKKVRIDSKEFFRFTKEL